jgi:GT2 family glycosyltransferase
VLELRPLGELAEAVRDSGQQQGDTNYWVANQGPAVFELVASGNRLPHGWVLLEGRLLRRGPDFTAKLYYDLGSGFSEDHFITPSISRKGRVHGLIWLPRGIRALRWQAMNQAGEFEQSPLRFKQVSSVERILRMLYRVVWTAITRGPTRCRVAGLLSWRSLFDLEGAYAAASKLRGYYVISYREWIPHFDALSNRDCDRIRKHIDRFQVRPRLEVVIPAIDTAGPKLTASLKSLGNQLYQDFSVLLIDRGGALGDAGGFDPGPELHGRVRVVRQESSPEFQIELFGSDDSGGAKRFVAILGEGDELAEHALYWIVAELQHRLGAMLLYSDSDSLDGAGVRVDPCFKPDWSPELLRSTNYVGGLVVYRADALGRAGVTGSDVSSAGGHELALRVAEMATAGETIHVPAVLYHRGFGSAARQSESSIEAVREHLLRKGIKASVSESRPGCFHVRYALPEKAPLVTILIPTRDQGYLLRQCVESVLGKTTYENFELIVINNQSRDPDALAYLASLEGRSNVRVLAFDHPFSFSAINNFGVEHGRGEVVCLLNNDTEVISPNWLEEMVGHLAQDQVGVVGAKLFYPDGRVQHAGDAVGPGGCADHMHSMIGRDDPGYCNRAIVAQNVSAVTAACLLTWKSLYQRLGGLDEKNLRIAFNDVDYCLRVREAGYQVVWTPHAELYHHESMSRGKDESEEAKGRTRREANYMRSRWRHVMKHDPFYNPNLSYERPDFTLGWAPVVERPWRRWRGG